jgi:paraquat-inducible protein A
MTDVAKTVIKVDTAMTGREAGLVVCRECHRVHRFIPEVEMECSRCGAPLHQRKPDSLIKTWAFLITSAMLFIPANLLTIMNVSYFGSNDPSTIMGGVAILVQMKSYSVALVVFIASIVVPTFKITGIFLILLSLKHEIRISDRQRIRMFRFIEFIGRWSMLDIFVISILAALVNISGIAVITAGPAATAFGATVAMTMITANTFDTRLLWDYQHKTA